mgnify:FL=1
MVQQVEFYLNTYHRGCHLITSEIFMKLPPLPQTGMLHLFLKHTSAALTLNENADPDVRIDLNSILNKLIPENQHFYTHTFEGPDDMPAHAKSSLLGVSLTIPISNGIVNLGTWQGIYLCEFRNGAQKRKVVATIFG